MTDVDIIKKVRELNGKMETLSRRFVEIAVLVEELRSMGASDVIRTLLATEARMSPEDIEIWSSVAEIADRLNLPRDEAAASKRRNPSGPETSIGKGNAPTHFASPETLRLVAASSEEVRKQAIRMIGSGQPVGQAKLAQIESFLSWSRNGAEQTAAERRMTCLKELYAARAPDAIRLFEADADRFLTVLHEFLFRHQPTLEDIEDSHPEPVELIVNDRYLSAHEEVARMATTLLVHLERLVGNAEYLKVDASQDPQANLIAQSHLALSRFSSGSFGHRGGFSLDSSANDMFSDDLWNAVCHLGTQYPVDPEPHVLHSRPKDHLRVLEFGAGAGGMAIGLMSAGFSHRAIYEKNNKRLATLRKNWLGWPVLKADITELSDAVLMQFKGIDLLAGGIPSASLARSKKTSAKGSGDDPVPHMIRAVEVVQPRAFMFDIPPSFAYGQHLEYLTETTAKLQDFGYNVYRHEMDTQDFGLPQKRKRIVLVGVRTFEDGAFIPPNPDRIRARSVVDMLRPLVIRHEAEPDPSSSEIMQMAQRTYNKWAAYWTDAHRESFLPTIPVSPSEKRYSHLYPFLLSGFDTSSYADTIPQVVDFEDYRGRPGVPLDEHFKPRLTLEMIAAAQGFPPDWTFDAIGGGNIDMIAEALPPVMAKAVGIQVYSALTGTTFDLDAALQEPMIDESRIGKDSPLRRHRPKWRTAAFIDKAEDLIRLGESLRGTKNLQRRQEETERLLKILIPSKRGNGAERVTMERDRLRHYVEKELAAREAEENHFFA